MTDIDAARARHVGEHICVGEWPGDTLYINECDFALAIAALDAQAGRVADGTYWAIGGQLVVRTLERDAARAELRAHMEAEHGDV